MSSTAAETAALLVFFDESCGVCRRVAWILSRLGNRGRIEFWPARDLERFTADPRALAERYTDMIALASSRVYAGYETYVQIAARTTALRPLHRSMQHRLVRRVGERLYRRIARSRRCRITPPHPPTL